VAGDYAAFRPRYPEELYQWLATLPPERRLAWDAGTGNGQAAVALAGHFTRVVATDFSAEQISQARAHPRVEYRVAPAEESGLPDRAVDLVTVAQALHWFDIPAFFTEVTRVLVPGGIVAAWTYGVVHADETATDAVLGEFYYREVGPFWPDNRRLVEEGYLSVEFPFRKIMAPPFAMKVRWTLPELVGYVGTWSAVSRYRKEKGDPIPGLESRLAASWGNPMQRREIHWPLRVLAGAK
jgi:ubiquinone/menaquinone biosynthesis C-methylase UbiE